MSGIWRRILSPIQYAFISTLYAASCRTWQRRRATLKLLLDRAIGYCSIHKTDLKSLHCAAPLHKEEYINEDARKCNCLCVRHTFSFRGIFVKMYLLQNLLQRKKLRLPLRLRLALWWGGLVLLLSFALLLFINTIALERFPNIIKFQVLTADAAVQPGKPSKPSSLKPSTN